MHCICNIIFIALKTIEEKMSTGFKVVAFSPINICLYQCHTYIICALPFLLLAPLQEEENDLLYSSMTFVSLSVCCRNCLLWSSCSLLSYFYEYPHFLTAAGFQKESVGWHPERVSQNIQRCLLRKWLTVLFKLHGSLLMGETFCHIPRLFVRCSLTTASNFSSWHSGKWHWLEQIS